MTSSDGKGIEAEVQKNRKGGGERKKSVKLYGGRQRKRKEGLKKREEIQVAAPDNVW